MTISKHHKLESMERRRAYMRERYAERKREQRLQARHVDQLSTFVYLPPKGTIALTVYYGWRH